MPEERTYTLSEIAALTGLHKNTVRNYLKKGILKATLQDRTSGGQTWVITEHNLYHSGNAKINRLLGPQETAARIERHQVAAAAVPDRYIEELLRVTRELTAAQTELSLLQDQVPRLQAAATERDTLVKATAQVQAEAEQIRKENNALDAKAQVLEAALVEARAEMRWTARRRLAKAARGTGPKV